MSDLPNVFAAGAFDRLAHVRKDADAVRVLLDDPATRFAVVCDERCLVHTGEAPAARLLAREELPADAPLDEAVLLGRGPAGVVFALAVSELAATSAGGSACELLDLRRIGTQLSADDASLLAYARAMIGWHAKHGFCPRCGSAALPAEAGHVRVCVNNACGLHQFPRTDPAVIVLVSNGDSCLLGSHVGRPAEVYSTLAGFVEPGESLEDAVRRELFEEAGIVVDDVRYHSSQPWPFPASLMLGFTATARSREVKREEAELRDLRWLTREELLAGVVKLPSTISIARRLIDDWIADADDSQ